MKKFLCLAACAALAVTAGCASGGSGDGAAENGFKNGGNITVVSRESGSGTRGAFIELFGVEAKGADGSKTDRTTDESVVANKTDVMLTNVSSDLYSIGYVSLGSLNDRVKAVKIDGVDATAANVKNGSYKIARPFNIAFKEEALSETARDFIGFILSAEGQEIVSGGYIPINENALPYSGSKPSGKVVAAGSSSVTPIMEKLKEAYAELNPDAYIEVQMSDSTSGMTAAMEETCDIGMASRDLSDKEAAALKAEPIAMDGIAVIVNRDNPVQELSSEDVKGIYTGTITSWDELK